ncbi:hypothetical protein RN001_011326 [Aquatica leii]|uniref:CRAL-TRIO domain-containing protein n=1 Tax=Aquatica leii TaxID=1421715 RepID=A0AAN7SQR1_9COLE|nr:hypothetical protein RN001_011326 [Aquatica leii]
MNEEKQHPKLKHPFLDGLKDVPQNKSKDLKKIRTWLGDQPHLPYISDEYIHLFLHACFYNQDKTKHAIETYFTIRGSTPSLFADRNAYTESMEYMSNLASMFRLPKATPEGYRVLMYTVKEHESTEYVFSDAIKGFCMYNDSVISEEGLAEGYIVIFDMKNLKLGHLARVSLPVLRSFMIYIQEAHPARLKAVHVINTAAFIKHAMRILQPMIRTEIIGLLRFHRGHVPDGIPQEILPRDYGGEAPSSEELRNEMFELRDKYAAWLKESEYYVADESKRIKKSSWWSIFSSANEQRDENLVFTDSTVFRQLEID